MSMFKVELPGRRLEQDFAAPVHKAMMWQLAEYRKHNNLTMSGDDAYLVRSMTTDVVRIKAFFASGDDWKTLADIVGTTVTDFFSGRSSAPCIEVEMFDGTTGQPLSFQEIELFPKEKSPDVVA